MATSGSFLTSDSGQGGGSYFSRLIFEWWRTGWGRSGGAGYHNISYQLKSYGGNSGYWQYTYNTSMNVDGTGYSRGQTQTYGAGATVLLSGSKTMWTDGAGNRSFGASAQSGIYTNAVNSSGSGSWGLDNIPMDTNITGCSGNVTDETTNVYIHYSSPTGALVNAWIELLDVTGNSIKYAQRNSYSSGANFNITPTEWNAIRSAMASTGQTTFNYVIQALGGSGNYAGTNYTYKVTIVNANPVFTTATYKDANSATVAITGDDQYIIQGKSQLEVDIASADKAVAQKYASMVKYNMAVGSINEDVTYDTADIEENLGTLGVNSNTSLTVKAVDSRNYQTPVVLPVNVLPYIPPQVTATAKRVNNFETETDFHIEATISRLTIDDVDKNGVNTSSGVRYRYKKTTDGSWGSWVNKTSSTTAGNVSVTDFSLTTELDRNFAWNIQVEVTDKLETTTVELLLSVGIPVFRIGLDGKVYNNELELATKAYIDALATRLPKFCAYRSSSYTLVAGTATKAPMNVVEYDTHSGFNTSGNSYTIPVGYDGYWNFKGRMSWTTNTAYGWLEIRKNGTVYKKGDLFAGSNEYTGHVVDVDVPVVAGDVITLYYQSGVANNIELGSQHAYFSGRLLP